VGLKRPLKALLTRSHLSGFSYALFFDKREILFYNINRNSFDLHTRRKTMKKALLCILSLALLIMIVWLKVPFGKHTTTTAEATNQESPKAPDKPTNSQKAAVAESKPQTDDQPIDWNAPSDGEYPDIQEDDDIWIDVSIPDQKVYIKKDQDTVYTMNASSGIGTTEDNDTPTGTYYVEPERGEWFYSPTYEEGAEYWVSWKNHGEYLFHSVPMNKDQEVIESEAKKLGNKASHGCIRLSIPDAKWLYDHIPTGTKVVIG
jgi:lipoprotein-anchoring transpeptidase ErfK/SrfK